MVPEAAVSCKKDLLGVFSEKLGTFSEVKKELYAAMACRMAVKEGEVLDAAAAVDLLKRAFVLDPARCPHGRPLWIRLSREELDRRIGRII